jgi:hypothetical protein
VTEVVFINDVPHYGLKLHLDAEIERVSIASVTGAGFNPLFDDTLGNELAEAEPSVVYVTQAKHWPVLERSIDALGYQPVQLGAPYRNRIFFAIKAH